MPVPRMRHHSGNLAPLLTGIAMRQVLSRTAQVQASLSRSGLLPPADPTAPFPSAQAGGHMAATQASTSEALERIASQIYGLAFDFAEPSRCAVRSERLIGEVEELAAQLRAVVRGR